MSSFSTNKLNESCSTFFVANKCKMMTLTCNSSYKVPNSEMRHLVEAIKMQAHASYLHFLVSIFVSKFPLKPPTLEWTRLIRKWIVKVSKVREQMDGKNHQPNSPTSWNQKGGSLGTELEENLPQICDDSDTNTNEKKHIHKWMYVYILKQIYIYIYIYKNIHIFWILPKTLSG